MASLKRSNLGGGCRSCYRSLSEEEMTPARLPLLTFEQRQFLTIVFAIGGRRFEVEPSPALCDPLTALAELALALKQQLEVRQTIQLVEEPGLTLLAVASPAFATAADISITGDNGPASMRIARSELLDDIVSAFAHLESALELPDELPGWGGIPRAALRRLEGPLPAALPPGWVWLSEGTRERVNRELELELHHAHELAMRRPKAIAANLESGEYLVENEAGAERFAVVSLTWSGRRERSPTPVSRLLLSWRAFGPRA